MSTDAYDVWDQLYGMMCIPCEHCDYCHGTNDDANNVQMIDCMIRGQIVRIHKQMVEREDIIDPIGEDNE